MKIASHQRGVISLLEMTLVLIFVGLVIAAFFGRFRSATENIPESDNAFLSSSQPLDLPDR